MKVPAAAFGLLFLAGSSRAQYFSAGWTPGQKAPAAEPEAIPFIPGEQVSSPAETAAAADSTAKGFSFSSLFDISNILTSGPAVALFEKVGVNITDKVKQAEEMWDKRVELITDDNYNDLIVNEELTPQQEAKRVWAILISAQTARQDQISKYADTVFDAAFNATQEAGDLPNVKWGRIDYLNVTYLTTKWGVWQAPYLVIVTDRGQSLRFYRHYQLRFREDSIREFLRTEEYLRSPPWSTRYGPGGDREYIMEFVATWITKIYNVAILIPRWVLLVITGGFGSVIISFLHRKDAKPKPSAVAEGKKPAVVTPSGSTPKAASPAIKSNAVASSSKITAPAPAVIVTPAATDSERESSAPPAKRSSTRQRKNKKA